jgi:hypothetical protein
VLTPVSLVCWATGLKMEGEANDKARREAEAQAKARPSRGRR